MNYFRTNDSYGFGKYHARSDMAHHQVQVLDHQVGDVNGDGVPDVVYLTGVREPGSPYTQQIMLNIQDGASGKVETIHLKQNAGYHPTIQLADFTGDRVLDILIVMDSGGSGGTIYSYVYSFHNNKPMLIFDFEEYNQAHQYTVTYEDHAKVRVVSEHPPSTYIIDLQYKGEQYLREIYDANGRLKEPIMGDVNPLSGLSPVDFERDGQYELMALQRITGRYNADGLGYVANILKWNGHQFFPSQQWVWITGAE